MVLNHARRGSGEPLLLLHSLGGSLVQWSPVLPVLTAHREVIAVDMPGFGDSPPLPDGIQPTAANLATGVVDFCESIGLSRQADVAGISLGGWVAIECARQGGARSVVGICAAGFWRQAPGGSSNALDRARSVGRRMRPLLGPLMWTAPGRRLALGHFVHHPERLSRGEARAMARAYVTAPAYPEASALMRGGTIGAIDHVEIPVTLAWGGEDQVVRNRPLRAGILPKRVRQVELPGCGHVPTWDDPDLVARVVLEGTGEIGSGDRGGKERG
jgi:pimeloyl-ACP methyl ester carboxylesterase